MLRLAKDRPGGRRLRSRKLSAWSARLLGVLVLVALAVPATARGVVLEFQTPIAGDSVPVTVTLADVSGGGAIDVTVAIPAGAGDLLGLFGNVADESLLASMAVSDPSGVVTQWQFQANSVSKVGAGNTMAPIKTWDWGVKLGQTGSAGGALESANFQLTAPGLNVAQVLGAATQGWVLGVRIQSTTGPEGSAKVGLSGDAPRIQITTPAAGTYLNATPTSTLGTVLGTAPAVSVNGVTAAVSGTNFSANVPLAEGPNTLTATATNSYGTASDAVDVVLDTIPPAVTIRAPPDGTLTTQALIGTSGTVTDASPIASFSVNGTAVPLDTSGAFATNVSLPLGESTITAVAVDAAGNTGSASIQVTRGVPPTISLDAPADGTLTNQTPAAASGHVTGIPAPTVTVNGVSASLSGGAFTAAVPLSEGANTLTATATNAFGTAQAAVSVTLDTTPPVVTITAPADGAELHQQPTAVAGTVADASPIAALALNGNALPAGTSFSTTAPLTDGANSLTVTATDAAGNTGSASVTVQYVEKAPLSVTIDTPPNGATVSTQTIAVAGHVSDPTAGVVVNGVAGTVTGTQYLVPAVKLAPGANTLTATATRDGDSASASASVTLHLPPHIVITAPRSGAVFRVAATDVEGVVDDPTAFVDVNGVVAQVDSGGRFVAPQVPLASGADRLTARAIDRLGAKAEDHVDVTRDDTATGRLVMVLVSPEAFDPSDELGLSQGPVVARNLSQFLSALARLGAPPASFDTPVTALTVSAFRNVVSVYVFSELGNPGDPVSLPAAAAFSAPTSEPLRAMDELDADLASLGIPGLQREDVVPPDFVPSGFARFDLFLAPVVPQ